MRRGGFLLHQFNRRDLPRAVGDRRTFLLRPVEAEHEDELVRRRRKPVRFLVCAGTFILNIEIRGTVGVGFEVLAGADAVAVQRVGNEKVFAVLHR